MRILTFDIGGANIKTLFCIYEDGKLEIVKNEIHYFPFWKKGREFPDRLKELFEEADKVAVTITAELSDFFSTKDEGIHFIVSAVEDIFPGAFYLIVEKELVLAKDIKDTSLISGANFAGSIYYMETIFNSGILVDIGSTTTDIIPFKKGETLYEKTDFQRLVKNQLVYSGILRTPVNCLLKKLPWRGQQVNIASEYFAITADIYKYLGEIEDYNCETPDGGGKSMADCARRISRLFCCEPEELDRRYIMEMAGYVREKQIEDIASALKMVVEEFGFSDVYTCGVGKHLGIEGGKSLGLNPIDLGETIDASDNLPCLGLVYMVLSDDCH